RPREGHAPKTSRRVGRRELYGYDTRNRKHNGPHLKGKGPMIERSKSVTHGTCALDGQHTDRTTAAECPVLRKRFRANQSSSEEEPATSLQGMTEGILSSSEKSSTSDTVFRYSRADKSGRP